MNCKEVQKYLPDVLDKSLDVERAEAIENHLATCSRCHAEVASLAECQRLVSGLPLVDPPVNFTTRVMTEVRDIAHPSSLWERFLLPFRVHIPLQATAVILIAVLAAYVYQKEPLRRGSGAIVQPESKQDETGKSPPTVARPPAGDSNTRENAEKARLRIQGFKDSAPRKEPQSPLKPEEQDNDIAGSNSAAPGALRSEDKIRSPATLSPTPFQENPLAASEATSARLEKSSTPAQAKEAPAPTPQSEKENAPKDATAAGKPLLAPEARRQAGSATSSLSALRSGTVVGMALPSDHQLAIRLKELGRDDKALLDRLASGSADAERRSLTSEEAKNFEQARERAIQTGQPQTVWVTVALNQYDLFKKELTDLGNIEAESSTSEQSDAAAKSSGRVRVKVTILPPLSSEKPAPSQPSSR